MATMFYDTSSHVASFAMYVYSLVDNTTVERINKKTYARL